VDTPNLADDFPYIISFWESTDSFFETDKSSSTTTSWCRCTPSRSSTDA
jgi:hypothetical protein